MRKGFLGSILTLVAGTGLTLAQSPATDSSPQLAGFFKLKESKKETKADKPSSAASLPEPTCPEPGISIPDGPNAFEAMPEHGAASANYNEHGDYYPCGHYWA